MRQRAAAVDGQRLATALSQGLGVAFPACTDTRPAVARRPRHGFGRRHRFLLDGTHEPVVVDGVGPPIHLAHARVDRGDHSPVAVATASTLRQRRQIGDANDRTSQCVADALNGTDGDAGAGERARPTPESDDVQGVPVEVGLGEHLIDHAEEAVTVLARGLGPAAVALTVGVQRHGARLGRRIQRQQSHCARASAADSPAKNAWTVSSASVRVIGGRLSRKTRP